MSTFFNKTLLVMLVCLSFMAQSMASMTMAYDMISMQAMTQQRAIEDTSMPSMSGCHENNATKSISIEANKNQTAAECCPQECNCLASACSSLPALLTMIDVSNDVISYTKIVSPQQLLVQQVFTSLYRPPILS